MANPMIAALLQPKAYPHPTSAITLLETHISWVVLTGAYAYKLKKPVNFGFLDFSSLERRRHFCQEELRLNKRLAADLYLDLVDIHGPPEAASLQGPGPVIEVAVRMRQFDQNGLLPRALAAGTLTGQQLEDFAERLAAFHGAAQVAAPGGPFGTSEAVVAPARANLEVLLRLQPGDPCLLRLQEWTHQQAQRLADVFGERLIQGRVREGHGDLHLGNLVLDQGAVQGFDCLEFNPALRWIDVLSDVAFLSMDLRQHGKEVWAGRVLNHWLMASGDYGSLATWAWYMTYRALVRAKVLALRLEQLAGENWQLHKVLEAQLHSYLQQAEQSSGSTPKGVLLLTVGVSGSGKSHLARHLCRRHGWIHLRSDVERRRLFGRWGNGVGPLRQGEVYGAEVTAEVYGKILPAATEALLQAGLTVVVDATFLTKEHRQIFLRLADRLQLPCLLLVCPISFEVARKRIASRRALATDPSEADEAVLMRQWQEWEPISNQELPHQILCRDLKAVDTLLQQRCPGLLRTTR